MSKVQLPALKPKRPAWNKGRLIGQKRPLLAKQVWAIRARLELAGNLRDLALRGGSVCLNSFELFLRWISRSVMPPPGSMATC
ncbi:hypothetical protein CLV76_1564, partial [Marivita geojedonensis]